MSAKNRHVPTPSVPPDPPARHRVIRNGGELQTLLVQHREWLKSGGKSGEPVQLDGAILIDPDLRQADLSGADLSGVAGLSSACIGGTILKGAKLPPEIAKFEGLARVAEVSQYIQGLFKIILVFVAYCLVTIVSMSDDQLLNDASSQNLRLQLVGADVPFFRFDWMAPIFLLVLDVYLLLYLKTLWEQLASLPAIFPDGAPLDARAYHLLGNVLIRQNSPALDTDRSLYSVLQRWVSSFLTLGLVPVTLFCFWLRCLSAHDFRLTLFQVCALVIASMAMVAFDRLAQETLSGRRIRTADPPPFWTVTKRRSLVLGVALFAALEMVSLGAFNGANPATAALIYESRINEDEFLSSGRPHWSWDVNARMIIPYLFKTLTFWHFVPFADLEGKDVSTKPANWSGQEKGEWIKLVHGADLEGCNIRFGKANHVFLARANMRESDLREADLGDADLRYADLRGANLGRANLKAARLNSARMNGTDVHETNLEKADLAGVDLGPWVADGDGDGKGRDQRISDLYEANLSGAILRGADLTRARLVKARLRGAILSALCSSDNVGEESITAMPHATKLVEADLTDADLTDAKLDGAQLWNATLTGADLLRATLVDAHVGGVDFSKVKNLTQKQVDAMDHRLGPPILPKDLTWERVPAKPPSSEKDSEAPTDSRPGTTTPATGTPRDRDG